MRMAILTACVTITGSVYAGQALDLGDETSRLSYSLGYQIGGDFKRQGLEMDAAAVVQGIEDALSGNPPKLSSQEMNATLVELKRKVVAGERAQRRQQELENIAEDQAFLHENAKRPGVHTTPSGLQYQILKPGSGRSPGPTDRVTVRYRGTLTNGQEFDSSDRRGQPASFRLDQVIKGWTEGLQKIKEGGRIRLVVPPALAYGDRGPLAHRTLVFDIELLSVEPQRPSGGEDPGKASRTAQ